MPLRAIRNHIIFQFEDSVVRKSDHGKNRNQFSETTDWGFEISNFDEGTKAPRWGIVTSVGPEVQEDIQVGSKILVDALQWTDAAEIDGEKFWRTDETKVLALDEDFQP